jgi:hypothetical protein
MKTKLLLLGTMMMLGSLTSCVSYDDDDLDEVANYDDDDDDDRVAVRTTHRRYVAYSDPEPYPRMYYTAPAQRQYYYRTPVRRTAVTYGY